MVVTSLKGSYHMTHVQFRIDLQITFEAHLGLIPNGKNVDQVLNLDPQMGLPGFLKSRLKSKLNRMYNFAFNRLAFI